MLYGPPKRIIYKQRRPDETPPLAASHQVCAVCNDSSAMVDDKNVQNKTIYDLGPLLVLRQQVQADVMHV